MAILLLIDLVVLMHMKTTYFILTLSIKSNVRPAASEMTK